jgi:ABC-type nitrate/sulfonate/bicarbonate transport system substrate-binding protein
MIALILFAQALTVAVGGPTNSPEYLPIRVAEAEGYFAREGLTVTLRGTRAESGAAEALAQGQVDLAATSLEALLRFGHRQGAHVPRLVFGLTAAPPVALLVAAADGIESSSNNRPPGRSIVARTEVRAIADLAGAKIALATPGGPEHTWLQGLLARAGLGPSQVEMVALGSRGVVAALDAGEVRAALVPEPGASGLVKDERTVLLVDLRSPHAVRQALGTATVNAAVFARADRRLGDRELSAFARALLAAERRITSAPAAALAARLPRAVVGGSDEFERRLEATRAIYLPDGLVTPEAIRATAEMIRTHLPLPAWIRIPRPEDLLHQEPLRRAIRSRSSG